MTKATCCIENCSQPVEARGWCNAHYTRWRRKGSPDAGRPSLVLPYEVRFWSFVDRSGPGCWEWQGARLRGYGIALKGAGRPGRSGRAHRVAWALTFGAVPVGMQVCHHCDNPPCVRPDHLFLGTAADNARDRESKGRNRIDVAQRASTEAKRAATHCKNDHLFNDANTLWRGGARECRACRAAACKRWRNRRGGSP